MASADKMALIGNVAKPRSATLTFSLLSLQILRVRNNLNIKYRI